MPLSARDVGRFASATLLAMACCAGAGCSADDAPSAPDDASVADTAIPTDAQARADAPHDGESDTGDTHPDTDAADGSVLEDASHDASHDAHQDAAIPYSPCPPAGTPCAIMPLGDSITYGVGSTGAGGGYRVELFHQALSHHQSITFVGSGNNGPATVDNVAFPRAHEGHSGFTIDDGGGRSGLQPFIAATIVAKKPNIVTLMIGTNDVDISLDLANAPTRLAKLVDTILGADPSLLLVIARIVPTKVDTENTRVQAYNAAIPGIVSARADAGKHIAMVDMYSAFTSNADFKAKYLSDNLHPTDAGYVVMAGVWYAAIGPLLRGP